MSHDIQQLIERLRVIRKERNWEQYNTPKNLAISIAIETGELLEHVQWRDDYELSQYIEKNKEDIADEVADIFNYLLVFCDILDIDLIEATDKKIDKSIKKYPVHKVKENPLEYEYSLKQKKKNILHN